MYHITELKQAIKIYEDRLEANRIAWEDVEKADKTLEKKKTELELLNEKISRYNDKLEQLKLSVDTMSSEENERRLKEQTQREKLGFLQKQEEKTRNRIIENEKKIEKAENDLKNNINLFNNQKVMFDEKLKKQEDLINQKNNDLIVIENNICNAESLLCDTLDDRNAIKGEIESLKHDKKIIEEELYNLSTKYIECHN